MLTTQNLRIHDKYYKKMTNIEKMTKYFKSIGYNVKLVKKRFKSRIF